MQGTILDFLNLTTERPELAKELVELATKYDFKFTSDELSDADLDSVAGGASKEEDDAPLRNIDLMSSLQQHQQTLQMMSNVSKMLRDTALSVTRKIG